MLWVDQGASMRFASSGDLPTKIDRARVLGLAMAILLVRAGERIGLTGTDLPPRRGQNQILRLAEALSEDVDDDYSPPEHRAMIPHASAIFLSDFLGDLAEVRLALSKAADRGVRGVMFQILDPSEEAFPFHGRTVFESMKGTLRHETLKASDLREAYLARLAERKSELAALCGKAGWHFETHHTDTSAQAGLLWLHRAMGISA
jgi:uncharacterized protein (DUF58 family)